MTDQEVRKFFEGLGPDGVECDSAKAARIAALTNCRVYHRGKVLPVGKGVILINNLPPGSLIGRLGEDMEFIGTLPEGIPG